MNSKIAIFEGEAILRAVSPGSLQTDPIKPYLKTKIFKLIINLYHNRRNTAERDAFFERIYIVTSKNNFYFINIIRCK